MLAPVVLGLIGVIELLADSPVQAAIKLQRRQILTGMGMTDSSMTAARTLSAPEIIWGTNATHIDIQMTYPTTGWMALGISPNGGMDQSDVLFGYVDDKTGEVVVQDRLIVANMTTGVNLSLDGQQDWIRISGSQNRTHTVLRAARKLRTCDEADRPFISGFLKIIFSYNPHDPQSKNGPIQKHTQRGSSAVNFLAESEDTPPVEPIVRQFNFTMGNFQVPALDATEYYCRLIKIPPINKKLQAVTETPILDPRSADLIHHIIINTCDKIPEGINVNTVFPCSPQSPSKTMAACQSILAGWAVGGLAFNFPPNVGLPFTPAMGGTYLLLQVHYNNPSLKKPVDNSGISFSLIDRLRKYDVGSLTTGILNLDYRFTIPPGLESFRMTAQCSDQCTSKIPSEGITIISAAIHMHTRGRIGIARHFRGNSELAPLIYDQNYDFNYQTGVDLSPPRKFLPGDRVVVECIYSTAAETNVTLGGESTGDEMCLAFFDYYPKTDALTACGAYYTLAGYVNAVGMSPSKWVSSYLPMLNLNLKYFTAHWI